MRTFGTYPVGYLAGTVVLLAGVFLLALTVSDARAVDFHTVFEDRCTSCHGHAGAFVRENLAIVDGTLASSRGKPLTNFLKRHAGGLTPDEIALFEEVFKMQIVADGLYEERCTICHDSARELARLELMVRDGVLIGRYTGRDIGEFMQLHGRLTSSEAERMTEALQAILQGKR